MTLLEAAKTAREALIYRDEQSRREAIAALDQAISEAEQAEPDVKLKKAAEIYSEGYEAGKHDAEQVPPIDYEELSHVMTSDPLYQQGFVDGVEEGRRQIEQAEKQEPVAWLYDWEHEGEIVTGWVTQDFETTKFNNGHNVRPLYEAPQPITTPDVCGEVCARAKLCFGCGKALDEANAKTAEDTDASNPLLEQLQDANDAISTALQALGPVSPGCCGCATEWQVAIDALQKVQPVKIPAFLRRPGSFGHE